jgi:hypothetical protein
MGKPLAHHGPNGTVSGVSALCRATFVNGAAIGFEYPDERGGFAASDASPPPITGPSQQVPEYHPIIPMRTRR